MASSIKAASCTLYGALLGGGGGRRSGVDPPLCSSRACLLFFGGEGGGVGTRPWWLARLACGGAYWPLAFEPSAMTSRHPYYWGGGT